MKRFYCIPAPASTSYSGIREAEGLVNLLKDYCCMIVLWTATIAKAHFKIFKKIRMTNLILLSLLLERLCC